MELADRPAWFDVELLQMEGPLMAFAMSLCRNHSRAQDLTHDTICRALLKFEQYEQGTSLKAWLFTIMRNLFFSAMRRKKLEVEDPEGLFAGQVTTPEAQTWAYDLKVIRKRMRMLNRMQRGAIELCGMQQHTIEHAAQVLGVPLGTVKSALHRAHAFLESGDVIDLEYGPPAETITDGVADIVTRLYGQGKSVAAIKAVLGDVSRSDIMRVIVERNLRGGRR